MLIIISLIILVVACVTALEIYRNAKKTLVRAEELLNETYTITCDRRVLDERSELYRAMIIKKLNDLSADKICMRINPGYEKSLYHRREIIRRRVSQVVQAIIDEIDSEEEEEDGYKMPGM